VIKRLMDFARSRLGRALAALVGVGIVALLIRQSGPEEVLQAITRAPLLFPLVVLLEMLMCACEVTAAFVLYGTDRAKVPAGVIIRSTLFCYAVMSVLPFGRAVAEMTRAAMLSKYVGGARAAAVATQVQGMTLLGNAIISVPTAIAVAVMAGKTLLLAGISLNVVVTSVAGGGLLLATRKSDLGQRVGKYFSGGEKWGPEVDQHLQGELKVLAPVSFMALGRCFQVTQRLVLLAAVGAQWSVLRAFCAQAIALVSSMVGDLIPGQIGVTEMGYRLGAQVLQLEPSQGVAIGLLGHLTQVVWIGVGFVTPLIGASEAKVQQDPSSKESNA
jgi:hypothetical protein